LEDEGMNEIRCPNCEAVFQVDKSKYAEIVKQVRDDEFEKDIQERVNSAAQLAEANAKNAAQEENSKKDAEIAKLNEQLNSSVNEKNSAVKEAVSKAEKERDSLQERVNSLEIEKKNEIQLAEANTKNALQEDNSKKDTEIAKLNERLKAFENEKNSAVKEAVSKVEKERDAFESDMKILKSEHQSAVASLESKHKDELKYKDEELARYKDMKSRLSSKMLGETLEQHCEIEFNRIRTAFPYAEFGKDNDTKTGSKGDYIYREHDGDNNEIISIMFEMKNEADETTNKKKNEDFFKKLDKDHNEKKCEYAVLVLLLEADNDFYNSGIADVSYSHEKMYVIRPQCFIPMITILRNSAKNSLECKTELVRVKNQNIDITTFETTLKTHLTTFRKHRDNATKQFYKAIEEIDETIKHLMNVREALSLTDKHLGSANNKLEEITIKRLTKGNPTMTAEFERLKHLPLQDE